VMILKDQEKDLVLRSSENEETGVNMVTVKDLTKTAVKKTKETIVVIEATGPKKKKKVAFVAKKRRNTVERKRIDDRN